jgi:hypothetical protein
MLLQRGVVILSHFDPVGTEAVNRPVPAHYTRLFVIWSGGDDEIENFGIN